MGGATFPLWIDYFLYLYTEKLIQKQHHLLRLKVEIEMIWKLHLKPTHPPPRLRLLGLAKLVSSPPYLITDNLGMGTLPKHTLWKNKATCLHVFIIIMHIRLHMYLHNAINEYNQCQILKYPIRSHNLTHREKRFAKLVLFRFNSSKYILKIWHIYTICR